MAVRHAVTWPAPAGDPADEPSPARPPQPTAPAPQQPRWDRRLVRELRVQASEALAQAERDRRLSAADRDLFTTSLLRKEVVGRWVDEQLRLGQTIPTDDEEQQLVELLRDHLTGLGDLQTYVDAPRFDLVENISIKGCDPILLRHADGRVLDYPPIVDSDDELIELIQHWARHLGNTPRIFSVAHPMLDMQVAGGHRLSAAMHTTARPVATLRRHRFVDVTLDDLYDLGTVDQRLHAFLTACTNSGKRLWFTGEMNSGKTTNLRAVANTIHPDRRIVTLETEFELGLDTLRHRHRDVEAYEEIQPNSEGVGGIDLQTLTVKLLRKNADWIIVGEVRGAEVVPMLQAVSAGKKAMTTLHAATPKAVFDRVAALAGWGGLAETTAYRMLAQSVDFIVHSQLIDGTGPTDPPRRVITHVVEVLPVGETGIPATNTVFAPDETGRAAPTGALRCLDDLVAGGLDPGVLSQPGRWVNTPTRRVLASRPAPTGRNP
jgi:pilus assembly protein CpaF